MPIEKNQNADFPSRSPEQSKLLEQKQALQKEIQDLKNLNVQIDRQQTRENQEEKSDLMAQNLNLQLEALEQKVDALDEKNTKRFQVEVQKIEEQIENIRKTREELSSFQRKIVKVNPSQLQSAVQRKLPDHAPKANRGRADSIQKILNIQPQDGGNPVANRAARRIQKLVN